MKLNALLKAAEDARSAAYDALDNRRDDYREWLGVNVNNRRDHATNAAITHEIDQLRGLLTQADKLVLNISELHSS